MLNSDRAKNESKEIERSYGQFYRLIPLPEDVDVDQVKAQFENGVLGVSIPIPEPQHRSIPMWHTA